LKAWSQRQRVLPSAAAGARRCKATSPAPSALRAQTDAIMTRVGRLIEAAS
jgi:hypothetical protein